MIDLKMMFDKCTNFSEVLRINANYINEIYVGYNELMQKTLVVRGKSKQKIVKSSKNIDVSLSIKNINQVSLSFSLLDDAYSTVFFKFCEDIILNSVNIEKDRIIIHTISRWKTWRSMFENTQKGVLSLVQIQGLVGELLFIKNHLMKKFDNETSINSWVGPEGNPKDFYCKDKWYEVKTINASKNSVEISSFEQLDSDELGFLVVIKLQKVSKEINKSISLNNLVFEITKLISDPYLLEVFNLKIQQVGYSYNESYNEIHYKHKNTCFYEVDDVFPRIKRCDVTRDILKVNYELLLINLNEERMLVWN